MAHPCVRTGLSLLAIFLLPSMVAAQVKDAAATPVGPDRRIDGPPAPIAPAVISRDDRGNATVRAIRLAEPLRLDGRLDEAVYRDVPAIDQFLQSLPGDGDPSTEKTEAWITFDADAVYVSARIWDSASPSEWVANEMRRDTQQLRNNDTFSVAFDTYYDRRNSSADTAFSVLEISRGGCLRATPTHVGRLEAVRGAALGFSRRGRHLNVPRAP